MKVTDERLDEIVEHLKESREISAVSQAEWASIARELKQLRLRTSSQSRGAFAGAGSSHP